MLNLALLIFIITLIFHYIRRVYSYWSLLGFPEVKAHIPTGCMLPFVKKKTTAALAISDTYYESSAPFVGIYIFFLPKLMIRDLELLRRILIHDFEYFTDRDFHINRETDPFSVNISTERGEKWRNLRSVLTPLFTATKLKVMFPIFVAEIGKLDKKLEQNAISGEPINLRDTVSNFILSNIASVLYGLDIDLNEEPNHVFKRMFKMSSRPENFKETLRQSITFFLPV